VKPLGVQSKAIPHLLVTTTSGQICLAGSALQLPFAAFLIFRAYRLFPNDPAETFAGLAFMHVAVIGALFCSWLFYGLLMKKNWLENLLLVLIALAPLAPTYATLAAT
jgi:hypothetical protein